MSDGVSSACRARSSESSRQLQRGASWPPATPLGGARLAAAGVASDGTRRRDGRRRNAADGLAYVFVPPGRLPDGLRAGRRVRREDRKDESPRHPVRLTRGFWIGQTEVTVAAFARVRGRDRATDDGELDGWSVFFDGQKPVRREGMSWRAPGFEQGPGPPGRRRELVRRRGLLRVVGRPPADRGGVGVRGARRRRGPDLRVGRRPGAARRAACCRPTWPTRPRSASTRRGAPCAATTTATRTPRPAGSFAPNGFGLHDMEGNVAEWCADWHDDRVLRVAARPTSAAPPRAEPAPDPAGRPTGDQRVVRGGSWADDAVVPARLAPLLRQAGHPQGVHRLPLRAGRAVPDAPAGRGHRRRAGRAVRRGRPTRSSRRAPSRWAASRATATARPTRSRRAASS